MDPIRPIDVAGHALQVGEPREARANPAAKRRLPLRAAAATAYSVVSDLGFHEPVTQAEIQLVLAALGDAMLQVLEPARPRCPALASRSDG